MSATASAAKSGQASSARSPLRQPNRPAIATPVATTTPLSSSSASTGARARRAATRERARGRRRGRLKSRSRAVPLASSRKNHNWISTERARAPPRKTWGTRASPVRSTSSTKRARRRNRKGPGGSPKPRNTSTTLKSSRPAVAMREAPSRAGAISRPPSLASKERRRGGRFRSATRAAAPSTGPQSCSRPRPVAGQIARRTAVAPLPASSRPTRSLRKRAMAMSAASRRAMKPKSSGQCPAYTRPEARMRANPKGTRPAMEAVLSSPGSARPFASSKSRGTSM